MISKEKKAAIIAEYGRKARRYRFTGGSDRDPYCQNRRAYRAFKGQPEGSSLQTRPSYDGRSETWSPCIT